MPDRTDEVLRLLAEHTPAVNRIIDERQGVFDFLAVMRYAVAHSPANNNADLVNEGLQKTQELLELCISVIRAYHGTAWSLTARGDSEI